MHFEMSHNKQTNTVYLSLACGLFGHAVYTYQKHQVLHKDVSF